MSGETCPICQSVMHGGYKEWHFMCRNCSYEKANFQPAINSPAAHEQIDEESRETGLKELRLSNFKIILESIKLLKRDGGKMLDVGCAHGWFLETAKKDFAVYGLEPDKKIFQMTSRGSLPIRNGYFPDALDENERFDVIIFNDVIEHIPNVEHILSSCYHYLNRDGLLVLNVPNSKGIFYRMSKIFCRLGYSEFFDRLWQKSLPSPHLHYFNTLNLADFLKAHNFEIKTKGTLPTLRLQGLYKRIAYTGDLSIFARAFIYVSVLLFLPIQKILPSDIVYLISQKRAK